ncbi:MAG: protein translocase subunit SecD [Chloroflexota bacterium]
MKGQTRWLVLTLILIVFAIWVSLPNTIITNVPDTCYDGTPGKTKPEQGLHIDFDGDCKDDVGINVRQVLGLDLVGGLRVLLQAELPPGSFTVEDLRLAANNVEKRVNALGVGEATVQVQGRDRILVELPGVTDTCQAINTIQKTALLEFVDFSGLSGQAQSLTGKKILTTQQVLIQQQRDAAQTATGTVEATPEAILEATAEATAFVGEATPEATAEATAQPGTDAAAAGGAAAATTAAPQNPCETNQELTGQNAEAPLNNPSTGQPFATIMTGSGLQSASAGVDQTGRWTIRFDLTTDGGAVFGPFTGAHINQPMAIVLDGVVLSAPTIQAQLPTGGTITGNFNETSAKQLALQLRSGALPIPLRVESTETVGATLGQESVDLSIRAGVIGVAIIFLFMIINYRIPGVAACLALSVFILLNLAMFKIIPVTLTLPAIVGFLISIGTAVDGNILIFERMREELRRGRDLDTAVDEGFARAWTSIRDSNVSTILISLVLFLFGQTPGASMVSGFAVTLILGLLLNLFTAIIVTRAFLHLLLFIMRRPLAQRTWLVGA